MEPWHLTWQDPVTWFVGLVVVWALLALRQRRQQRCAKCALRRPAASQGART